MKVRRRTMLMAVALPVLVVLVLALVPLLLRGRLESALQAQLEKELAAHVTWSGAGVSLLRDFPNATLNVRDLAVTGVAAFAGDTLLHVPLLRAELDLLSVWRSTFRDGTLDVRGIDVHRPRVSLRRLEDGRANWDIVRPRDPRAAQGDGGTDVALRTLVVAGGEVSVDDRLGGLSGSVRGLHHTLSGDFRRSRFVLRSRTSADSVSLQFAGIPWLSRAAVAIDAELDADMPSRRFTLRDNIVRVNALELRSTGWLELGRDSGSVDIAFAAPRTDFRDILSLVPAIYARDFAALQTTGTLSMNGRVHGGVGEGAFPAFQIDARVVGGSFRYPDLPLPAREIALELAVTNPGGSPDSTVLHLRRGRIVLGTDAVEGSFTLRSPISDPAIDARLAGRLELENIGRTVKLDAVHELRGTIIADAAMQARQSDVDARRFDRIAASGSIAATQLVIRTADTARTVIVERALLRLTPEHAELAELRVRSGSSDVAVAGTVNNLLSFALGRDVLRGEARVTSAHVNLNEWRSDDAARTVPVPRNIDVTVRAQVGRLTLGTLEMRNAAGSLRVANERASLDGFRVEMLGGSMTVDGLYETLDAAHPRFDVALGIADFDVPTAFAALATLRAMAPVAAYAQGRMSANVELAGRLGEDLTPDLSVLVGDGVVETRGIVIRDFPAFDRLADRLSVDQLRDPALRDLRSSFEVRDGRLHVRPFELTAGPVAMTVTGSNGFDQTLAYELALRLPRSVMGRETERVVASLAAQTERAGVDLHTAQAVGVGVRITGTVRDPQLGLDLRDVGGSTAAHIEQALRERATAQVDAVHQRADSAAAAARQQAEAEAARILAEAEQAANGIREQARTLAERTRQEGSARADSLVAHASSPAARIAARAAADRLRRESSAQADRITREADERADALVDDARRRADAVRTRAN